MKITPAAPALAATATLNPARPANDCQSLDGAKVRNRIISKQHSDLAAHVNAATTPPPANIHGALVIDTVPRCAVSAIRRDQWQAFGRLR